MQMQESGIIAWMARNPVAANLLLLVVMIAGLQALSGITKEVFPSFPSEVLIITVPYPGSSPEEVEEGILIKIEEEIQDIVGIKEIRSVAKGGSGVVTVVLYPGTEMADVINKVKNRVDSITSFPLDAEVPIIEERLRRSRTLNLSIYGKLEERQLKNLADEIRDEILLMPGITHIEISGTRDFEISIELSDAALRQYGLVFDDVVNTIKSQSRDLPGGTLRTEAGSITLRSIGQAYTAAEFSALSLLTRADGTRITVGDVAVVRDAFEDQPLLSRLNGRPSINLLIDRVGSQDVLAISKQVNAYVVTKQQQLPEGVKLAVWADRTITLKSRISLLLKSAAQGILLVMITLALFLQLSLAFWVVMGLPFCFLGTLFVMNLAPFDLSVNVVSLFGFILVLGILVDDAIVTAESAYNQLEIEGKGLDSIIRGVKKVAIPTTFGVLTTIIAFLPVTQLDEGIGRLFSVAAPVVIICMLFSLIETKLILPAHLRHVRLNSDVLSKNPLLAGFQRLQKTINLKLNRFIEQRYRPLLLRAVSRRYVTLSIFVAVFIWSLYLIPAGWLRLVFFPNVPSDIIIVQLEMPQGTPYQKTHEYALVMERAALAVNQRYRQQTGAEHDVVAALMTTSPTDTSASIYAELIPSTERDITSVELARWWREALGELTGVKALTIDANAGHASVAIDVELQSDDLDNLRLASEAIKTSLVQFNGVYDVRDTFDAGGPEVDIRVTAEGQALGLGQVELARQVRQAFFGAEIQRVQRGRHEVRVYARFPASERNSLQTLRNMWVHLPNGNKVPFTVVGEIHERTGISVINRIDRRRVVNVQADVNKSLLEPGQVLTVLEQEIIPAVLADYPNVNYRFTGEAEEQADTTESLLLTGLIMIMMVYAALAIPLKSYTQPLLIMSVIPFGVVGALVGHLLMGKDISIISIIGMVALSGVVINDSLVLVDYINQRMRTGQDWAAAVLAAGERRFRAVILTSATTFMGLLPIQLETSIQAQFLKPMAISIAFGVLFSTFVTLLLVPVLYFIARDGQQGLNRLKQAVWPVAQSSTHSQRSASPKSS